MKSFIADLSSTFQPHPSLPPVDSPLYCLATKVNKYPLYLGNSMVFVTASVALNCGVAFRGSSAKLNSVRRSFHTTLRRHGAQKSEEVKEIKGIPYAQLKIGEEIGTSAFVMYIEFKMV